MPFIVVSLIGSSWSTRWPVAAAQSISSFRSWNSPTPNPASERSEKTGIAVPAPRHLRSGKRRYAAASTMCSPSPGRSFHARLGPSSHMIGVRVLRSAIRNLYSNLCGASSRRSHSGNRLSSIGTIRCHPSSSLPLPATASTSSGRRVGRTTRRVMLPPFFCCGPLSPRPNMPRVKAEE